MALIALQGKGKADPHAVAGGDVAMPDAVRVQERHAQRHLHRHVHHVLGQDGEVALAAGAVLDQESARTKVIHSVE